MINLRKLAYQYTDEQAQNAVGIILTDSPSINFLYDAENPSISGTVLSYGVDHNQTLNYNILEHRTIDDLETSISGLFSSSKISSDILSREELLGNPLVDGYILSSTLSGVRSWIPTSSGIVEDSAESIANNALNISTLSGTVDINLDNIAINTTNIATLSGTVVDNTDKLTNATHDGEVTGSGTLTITDNVVDEANLLLEEGPTNDYILTADSAKSGGMKWEEPVIQVGTVQGEFGYWNITSGKYIPTGSGLVWNDTNKELNEQARPIIRYGLLLS